MDEGERVESRLNQAASPYLRSAAHQPVHWYEWGEDAFAKARAEDKPILLDIGAVWCHWCHVIDRESYEDPAVAALINEHFVAVKVDRDERPDVDARFQPAVSIISGQGGWPLTAFLTPEGKPFYGGTYFPPEDRMGRPGFRRVLLSVAEAFRSRRAELENAAESLAAAVARAEVFAGARLEAPTPAVDVIVAAQLDSMAQSFDVKNGGFGHAPKFPHSTGVDLLLERYQQTREKYLLVMAESTLLKMACGGVYDQLAGGFHRYSVDERWLVPHFEKMSYDNSQLLRNYMHAWQVTRNPLLRQTAEGIITWVNDVLSDRARGGFYASQDADMSLDDDGDYFTWTLNELRAVLSSDEAHVMELYYDVGPHGEMHHDPARNVLWVAREPAEIAATLRWPEEDVRQAIAHAKRKMLEARHKRKTPFVDQTLYLAWNAMFVSAYLEAARTLGGNIGQECRALALKTLDRMVLEAWSESRAFRHRIGGPEIAGTLDDQVFAAMALLDAYEATLEPHYFRLAVHAMERTMALYGDVETGGFFDRATDAGSMAGLALRRKPFQDSPTPGANAVALVALVRLHAYTGEARYEEWAQRTLNAFSSIAPQYGSSAGAFGLAATLYARHPLQVVVTGRADDPAAQALEAAANGVYRFGKGVLRVTLGATLEHLPGALRETLPSLPLTEPHAIVCLGQSCLPPVQDPGRLEELLLDGRRAAAIAE
jgi:hypothetical protein